MAQNVLILGDNRVSNALAEGLLSRGHSVTIAGVHTSTDDHQLHNVRYICCKLTPEHLNATLIKTRPDCLISTTSGGSYETQAMFIEQALKAGVRRFMPCEFNHDTMNTTIQKRLPPHKARARVIELLQLASQRDDFSWCAIATGVDLEHGLKSGSLGFDLKWQSATIHGTGNEPFAASCSAWVGRVVAAALDHWDAVHNRYIYVSEVVTTANQLLAALQMLYDQEWQCGRNEAADILSEAERRFSTGFSDSAMVMMERSVLFDASVDGARPFIQSNASHLLHVDSESVEEMLRRLDLDHRCASCCT